MSLHAILGYITVAIAGGGFVLALVTTASRSAVANRATFVSFLLGVFVQLPALATGVVANIEHLETAGRVAPYNIFVSSSLFTLTAGLATWRGLNPTVLWERDRWVMYHAATLGNLLLGGALVWLGRLARM